MKKVLALVICVAIILCGTAFASAEAIQVYQSTEYGYTAKLPEKYIILDRSNLSKNSEFIERIGYSVNSFSSKLTESNIVMYAATEDNTHQVQIKRWQSDFSKGIGNLSALDEERRNTALEAMAKPISEAGNTLVSAAVGEVGDSVYLCYTVQVEGKFSYTEYVTVVGGYGYSLVYYNSSPTFSAEETAERDKIISNFAINGAESDSIWGGYSLTLRIISAVLLIAAVVFAVYLVSSFVRDIRSRRNSPEVIPDHIKMKYK